MLDFTDNVVNVSDIIERIEELREARDELASAQIEATSDELSEATAAMDEWEGMSGTELAELEALMDEMAGNGGDEQWEGVWYPSTLIQDSHFTDYAKEMLEDCGTIPTDLPSWVAIDWDQTAEAVQQDYTSVYFDGNTFWYR